MERRRTPFTCYFCHKKIENETEVGHTSICGNVLIPCPHKCGAYVPRMDMSFHQKECPNRVGRSVPKLETALPSPETLTLGRKPYGLTKDLLDNLQQDIVKLSTRLSRHERTSTSISFDTLKNQQDLDKVKYEAGLLLEWRKAVDYKLEALKQTVVSLEKSKAETDVQWMAIQRKFRQLDNLQVEIARAQETFLKEQNYNRQSNLEFTKNFEDLKIAFEDEKEKSITIQNHQQQHLDELFQDLATVKLLIEEQKAKNASVVFDIKTISQIAAEAGEKLEIQEREFAKFRADFEQMKLDLDILEDLATSDAHSNSPGHIIWKIADFDTKMAKAKETSTVLKGPIFYTHNFGYKIRILVYLNGLKKWKDRYMLVTVHVLKGEYDALLNWPCQIDGTITLRDLASLDKPRNFVKRIVAKRHVGEEENEEPQESSLSYIFIPHSTLTKEQYLKNNELYLEFKVDQTRKLLTETTL